MRKVAILLIMLFSACSSQDNISISAYQQILNDTDSGLKKSSEINGFEFSAAYLPAGYIATREFLQDNTINRDSLTVVYNESYTFIIGMKKKNAKNDLMFEGVSDMQEYESRMQTLNFNMGENIRLLIDGKEYAPVLTNFINTYGVKEERELMVVFSAPDNDNLFAEVQQGNKDMVLVYDDIIFDTGITRFGFKGKDIKRISTINIMV